MAIRSACRGAGTFDITKAPRMRSNAHPAPTPPFPPMPSAVNSAPKEPVVYTASGLTGTAGQKKQRIDELRATLGDHVTVIEVPEGVTLNRIA